jgi:hypothetical protein
MKIAENCYHSIDPLSCNLALVSEWETEFVLSSFYVFFLDVYGCILPQSFPSISLSVNLLLPLKSTVGRMSPFCELKTMFPHPRLTGPLTTYIATRVGSHSHDFQLPGVLATKGYCKHIYSNKYLPTMSMQKSAEAKWSLEILTDKTWTSYCSPTSSNTYQMYVH